jgi:galactonate dehydratase
LNKKRGRNMAIRTVREFLVHPYNPDRIPKSGWIGVKNWLLVKVETDEGIVGWGEAYTGADRDRTVGQYVSELGRYLIGRDPFKIKHFGQIVYLDFAGRRGSMDLFSAASAIEQALWDIVGKTLKTPVYNMLGGPCRNRIRVYANGWCSGISKPEELARRARSVVEAGFTAIKFYPVPKPWRLFISKEEEKIVVENVKAVREAVGPDIDLLIDMCRGIAPANSLRIARMIEEFNPFWYEEPASAENLDALAEIRKTIDFPIVTGECLYTKQSFREVLEKGAADILNPDVASCGGILEFKEIAAMAEAYDVAVSPHNYNSTTVALAATIQAAAVIPNFIIAEYYINFAEAGKAICLNPLKVNNGYIELPTAPGLGLEIDEDALRQFSYRQLPLREFRTYEQEGP